MFGAREDIGEKCCVKKNTTSIQNFIKHKLPPRTHMKTSHTSLTISIFIFLFYWVKKTVSATISFTDNFFPVCYCNFGCYAD